MKRIHNGKRSFKKGRIPALLLTACMLTGLYPLQAAAETQEEHDKRMSYAETITSAVNDARAARGLGELKLIPELCDLTQIRAEELVVFFDHDRPDGRESFTVLKENGYGNYALAAENIAAGNSTPLRTFDQWMNSQGHRDNILTPSFNYIGIGYCYNPDVRYKHFWGMFLIAVYDETGQPYDYPQAYKPDRDLGDADGSKTVNAADAAYVLSFSAEKAVGNYISASEKLQEAADINKDGSINAVDASIILAYAAKSGVDSSAAIEDYIW